MEAKDPQRQLFDLNWSPVRRYFAGLPNDIKNARKELQAARERATASRAAYEAAVGVTRAYRDKLAALEARLVTAQADLRAIRGRIVDGSTTEDRAERAAALEVDRLTSAIAFLVQDRIPEAGREDIRRLHPADADARQVAALEERIEHLTKLSKEDLDPERIRFYSELIGMDPGGEVLPSKRHEDD